ncbi:MAG: DsbA family protein [Holosporaceae bacterium]|nr:DsbA family protein [Holosporaceae bacterium]
MKKLIIALSFLLCFAENLEGKGKRKVKKNPEIKVVAGNSFFENLKNMDFPDSCKLRKIVIGDEDAPNTVIICSSFTCSHCRDFHQSVLPDFKKKYVDTGKAKVQIMFYVDDPGAMEAATLVRCLGKDSDEVVLDLQDKVYSKQKEWMSSKNPKKKLRSIFKGFGYDEKKIEKCIADKKIQAGVMSDQKTMMHELNIHTIPAFVVNGKVHQGKLSVEEIAAMFSDSSAKEK